MGAIVSVLIPTRNRPHLALKAIRSALTQSYPLIEIVVTDNSDSDQLSELIGQLGDSRILYIKNQNNIGPISNWKKALDNSHGAYCLILPDDDYLINPFYIEDALQIFLDNPVSIVIPDCIISRRSCNALCASGYRGLISGKDFIRKGLHIPHIGNVFEREAALRHNPFHSNTIFWSDIELWMKMLSECNAYCYSTPSVIYLFHGDNIVLNMSRSELIANAAFIRPSVDSFADNLLISEILVRYLCTIDPISDAVDQDFIRSVVQINNVDGHSLRIFTSFWARRIKRHVSTALSRSIKALKFK